MRLCETEGSMSANPLMTRIACDYDAPSVADIEGEVARGFESCGVVIPRGGRIAIAVGSRGIANLPRIVLSVAREVERRGGKPFIVPAMGSHGGATAEGQARLLAGYGISEKALGIPVLSSMDVVELPAAGLGHAVFMDKQAYESDGVIAVNRIKAHTDYHGFPESGVIKMLVLGLGKHRQALEIHSFGVAGLKERILPTARLVLGSGKILCGVGVVENALDGTMVVEVMKPDMIEARERELLELSKRNMPRLPADDIDVLVVDEMGKDLSGVGMDPNIIGRIRVRGQDEPEGPRIRSIMVTRLTEATHGNAIGMGLADVVTRELHDAIDYDATMENVVTSGFLERGKVPVIAETEAQAWAWALRAAAVPRDRALRAMRIRNSLRLDEVYVTEALLEELRGVGGIRVLGAALPLLDGDRLVPFGA